AEELRAAEDLAPAARPERLEALRVQGCDATGALYQAYLARGQALADEERMDEAVAQYDKALAVKDGTEARQARELAVAYRDGRAALDRRDWATAIERLESVHQAAPTFARGNGKANLLRAQLLGAQALLAEGRPGEAQALL